MFAPGWARKLSVAKVEGPKQFYMELFSDLNTNLTSCSFVAPSAAKMLYISVENPDQGLIAACQIKSVTKLSI